MTSIIDRVMAKQLNIGSTYQTKLTTSTSSNMTLTLPSTNGSNKQCFTAVGSGDTTWYPPQCTLVKQVTVAYGTSLTNQGSAPSSNLGISTTVTKLIAGPTSKDRYNKVNLFSFNSSLILDTIDVKSSVGVTLGSGASAGGYISATILNNGCPIITFINSSTSFVTIAICSTADGRGVWYIETIDSTSIAIGTSICILANGCPAIAYLDTTTTNLMLAVNSRPDGMGTWIISSIETTGSIISTYNNVSIDVLTSGLPIIAYYYSNSADLRIAVNSQIDGLGVWTINTIDSTNDVGSSPKIALLSNGTPIIAYIDVTASTIKVAVSSTADGSGIWTLSSISTIVANSAISLIILANGLPAVAYFISSSSTTLQFAYNTLADGSGTWNSSNIATTLNYSSVVSLGITTNGTPYVITCQTIAGSTTFNTINNTAVTGLGSWLKVDLDVNGGNHCANTILTNGLPASIFYTTPGNLKVVVNWSPTQFNNILTGSLFQINALAK